MIKKSIDERGAVSFLSVLVFIIIIVTVTLAYMQSVTRQQRSAINYDMGNRAYYAAEAGVQDTIRALRDPSDPNRIALTDGSKDDCLESDGTDAFGGTGIIGGHSQYNLAFTCQLVDTNTISSVLNPGQDNATMRISPASGGSLPSEFSINIQWGVPAEGVTEPTQYYSRPPDGPRYFSPATNWNRLGLQDGEDGAQPIFPLLRASVITHPSGSFNRSDIRQRVAFLNPIETSGAGLLGRGFDMSSGAISSNQQANIVTRAVCSESAPAGSLSACRVRLRITNHAGEVYLNLASLYRQAQFVVSVQDDSGDVIELGDTMATIDVTARAGNDIFRRVQQTILLGNNFQINHGSDAAALIVGDGICKDFSVGNAAGGLGSTCTSP